MSTNIVQMPGQDGGGSLVYVTPLVPEGEYLLAFSHHETVWQFHSHKLVLHFRVVSGPRNGVRLCRYYAVQGVATRSRQKGGQFKAGQKSDFFREYCRVFGAPARLDRITPATYRNTVVLGEVVTVTKGHDQQPIPEGARYSKVSRLFRLEAGKG
jgi:hypothetical protein